MTDQRKKLLPTIVGVLLTLCFCWFIRLDQILTGEVEIATLGIDSDQFLSVAGSLVNSEVPLVGGVSRFESGFDIRTPAYPVLLAGSLLLMRAGVPLNVSIVLLHALFLAATLLCLFYLLGGWRSRPAIAAAFLLSAIPMRHHFFMLLAEWPAFCLLTLFLGSTIPLYTSRECKRVFLPMLLASATTLTRPDYVVLFPVVAAIVLLRCRISLALAKPLALGSLPIVILLIVNVYRFQRLTIAPAEGHAFALLSPYSSQPEIEQQLGDCKMPGITVPLMQTGLNPTAKGMIMLSPDAQIEAGTANLNQLADAFYAAGYRDWNITNFCLLRVSRALLSAHQSAYLENYLYSLMTLVWLAPFLMLALIWKPHLQRNIAPSATLFAIALCTHAFHVAFVSAVNIMHLRYYIITFSPIIMATCILFFDRYFPRTNRNG